MDALQKILQPQHQIVDIDGLAKVLKCSKDTIQKTWRRYPFFKISDGNDARSVRFDVDDVLNYLKGRDYDKANDGSIRPQNRHMGRGFQDKGVSKETEARIRNGRRGPTMGERPTFKASVPRKGRDPIEDFAREFGLS